MEKKIDLQGVAASEIIRITDSFSESQIVENFKEIISLKERSEQEIRDQASKILEKISQETLAANYDLVLNFVRSDYFFVREEAKRILAKISPELLFDYFDYLLELQKDPNYNIAMFANELLPKIALAWPIKEKKDNYALIVDWQKSKNEETVKIANLIALQIMQTWRFDELRQVLPFLIERSNLDENDYETAEIANHLAYKVLSISNINLQKRYLSYMTGFNIYVQKEMRRNFRHLALSVMKKLGNDVDLSKYSIFFLRCLEGKNKEDRTDSWKFLLQINPDDLPIRELLYRQASGLCRVRKASKKLAKKISTDKLLENFEELLIMQDANDWDVCRLAKKLTLKIPLEKIRDKQQLLEKYLKSPYFGASLLSGRLLSEI